jgi:hypothetical protein
MYNNDTLALWDTYVLANVGPKEARTFRNATLNPKTEFHNRVVLPQHFRDDTTPGFYLAVSDKEFVEGRNHYSSEKLVGAPIHEFTKQTYFTNPLRITKPLLLDPDDWKFLGLKEGQKFFWEPPKERVALGLRQTFTFEFDVNDIDFFRRQMGWLRSSSGKDRDSTMGALFRACSQWVDFEGITVTWSGNKSLHIHLVFHTGLATTMVAGDPRDGLKHHWDKLKELVVATLQPDAEPDTSLKEPEKYRRLPHGSRALDRPNLLGMPAGLPVPQITLWEMYRDRAPNGADRSFFSPTTFAQTYAKRSAKPSTRGLSLDLLPFTPEFEYCKQQMRQIYDGVARWPQFHDFEQHEGNLRARFYNSPGDKKPDSFMDWDWQTVNIVGGKSNPMGLTPQTSPRLPKPLGEMVAQWLADYEAKQADRTLTGRQRTPIESKFAQDAVDEEAAVAAIGGILRDILMSERGGNHFISAPEGISKSRSLIAATPNAWKRLELNGGKHPTLIMYAFDTKDAAEEKAAEFNAQHGSKRPFGREFVGVVLKSFSHLYADACDQLGVKELTLADAAQHGHGSLFKAIEARQPDVILAFEAYYRAIHRRLGRDMVPVIFTVHEVAHEWMKMTHTRQMFARAYWRETDPQRRHHLCQEETRLGLLIHDEINVSDLILQVKDEDALWVETMVATASKTWSSMTAAEQWTVYEAHRLAASPSERMSFALAGQIAEADGWDKVATTYSGEYGEPTDRIANGVVFEDIYAKAMGAEWRIQVQPWPEKVAPKAIVLTTETVPTAVVRKIGAPWAVIELDTPSIDRNEVEVRLSMEVRSQRLGDLVLEEQKAWGGPLHVISNKVAHLTNTKTHAKAKGSNAYIGCDVLQTMAHMAVEQFEQLEALNAWTGRDDLVLARHMDEFNQTAGRNLGFRFRDGARHVLLIHSRLYRHLANRGALALARYDLTKAVTRRDKQKAVAPQKPPAPKPVPTITAKPDPNAKRKLAAIREKLLQERYG